MINDPFASDWVTVGLASLSLLLALGNLAHVLWWRRIVHRSGFNGAVRFMAQVNVQGALAWLLVPVAITFLGSLRLLSVSIAPGTAPFTFPPRSDHLIVYGSIGSIVAMLLAFYNRHRALKIAEESHGDFRSDPNYRVPEEA